jgi:hypothetical protein
VCPVPIDAERIVFHNLLPEHGTYSPPATLIATISNSGDDVPGLATWQHAEGKRVRHAAVRLTGPHPRLQAGCALCSVLTSLVAPLLRRGVRVALLNFEDWPHFDIARRLFDGESPRDALQSALAGWMRWNARLVEEHVAFEQGQAEEWSRPPEWK